MNKGWIGVDLDGTLAFYQRGQLLPIGPPVPAMVERVKRWLDKGYEVRVLTARMSDPDKRFRAKHEAAIQEWCAEHIGRKLAVTCVKDFSMIRLYDDRAVRVEHNTGSLGNFVDDL